MLIGLGIGLVTVDGQSQQHDDACWCCSDQDPSTCEAALTDGHVVRLRHCMYPPLTTVGTYYVVF